MLTVTEHRGYSMSPFGSRNVHAHDAVLACRALLGGPTEWIESMRNVDVCEPN
jgi:hypothetical protein